MRGRHSSSVVRLVVVYDADSTQSCNEILICLLHFSRSDTDRELSPCPTISSVVSTAMWGCQAVRGDKQPKNTQNRDLDGTRSGFTLGALAEILIMAQCVQTVNWLCSLSCELINWIFNLPHATGCGTWLAMRRIRNYARQSNIKMAAAAVAAVA